MPRRADPDRPLTDRQQLLVDLYLGECRFDAKEAGVRAGYGTTRNSAQTIASIVLRKPHVRRVVEKRLKAMVASGSQVLAELSAHAFENAGRIQTDCMYDETESEATPDGPRKIKTGRLLLDREKVKELGLGHLIRKVTRTAKGDVVDLWDKDKALELLGRYHGLWTERGDAAGDLDPSKLSTAELIRIARPMAALRPISLDN